MWKMFTMKMSEHLRTEINLLLEKINTVYGGVENLSCKFE